MSAPQPQFLLIHGYGTSLVQPSLAHPQAGIFPIFESELGSGQARAFNWSLSLPTHSLAAVDPFFHLKLYRAERAHTLEKATQQRLAVALENSQVPVVICHSLGCHLLLETLKNYPTPHTLKKIIFVGADVPHTTQVAATHVTNIYCVWDHALIASAVLHGYLPAGLVGLQHQEVSNIHVPYILGPNLHQNIWRDPRLKKLLIAEVKKT